MNPLAVKMTVSDPWDVGEAVNWQVVHGTLPQPETAHSNSKVLVKFHEPISYKGLWYHHAVMSPRREDKPVAKLFDGDMVSCVLIGISEPQADSGDPLDTSKWRGGLGFEADVKPA